MDKIRNYLFDPHSSTPKLAMNNHLDINLQELQLSINGKKYKITLGEETDIQIKTPMTSDKDRELDLKLKNKVKSEKDTELD